jgi:ubiquinone/menaquinone biosynthesis C-methylase UbiE
LEVGCGAGERLVWLQNHLNADCFGIDPSKAAVEHAVRNGIKAVQSTADILPYDNNTFDIVIFGFCLYLCDRDDLFKIVFEANRVLKENSWVIILDFYSRSFTQNEYHHLKGINSYKMDYNKMFDWHPSYTCFSKQVLHHVEKSFTDSKDDWISISVIRKKD